LEIYTIELASIDDLIYYVYTRLTAMTPSTPILCSQKECYTMILGENYVVLLKAKKASEITARYAYVDDSGIIRYTNNPPPGRPIVIFIRVQKTEGFPVE